MENVECKTRLGTKFLSLLIVNFFICCPFIGFYFGLYSGMSIFEIIGITFGVYFKSLGCISVSALLWESIEVNKFFDLKNNKLGIIAIVCIFSPVLDMSDVFKSLDSKVLCGLYIGVAIEIFSVFYIEKLFISLSRKPDILRKISNFCNNLILIYIYAIVLVCFLTWIPNLNWEILPIKILWNIVGPYMVLFTNYIPSSLSLGIDFSPVLAIMVLELARKILGRYFLNVISDSELENKEERG